MKASKKQVENAILFFAKKFDLEESYNILILKYKATPKIVEMIVYDMFLHSFTPSSEEEYKQYEIIHEYATELKRVGYVIHEQ